MTITKDSAGCSNATVCYAAMPMERLRYLAGMICMVEARQEHARRKQMQSEQKSPSLLSVYEWIDYWQEGSDQHLVDQFDMQRDGKKELEWAAKAISHLIGTMRDICDVPHESNPDFATAVRYAKNALTEYGVK